MLISSICFQFMLLFRNVWSYVINLVGMLVVLIGNCCVVWLCMGWFVLIFVDDYLIFFVMFVVFLFVIQCIYYLSMYVWLLFDYLFGQGKDVVCVFGEVWLFEDDCGLMLYVSVYWWCLFECVVDVFDDLLFGLYVGQWIMFVYFGVFGYVLYVCCDVGVVFVCWQ